MIGNGRDALKGPMTSLGPNTKAEFGLMIVHQVHDAIQRCASKRSSSYLTEGQRRH